jgi:hypothetical protein
MRRKTRRSILTIAVCLTVPASFSMAPAYAEGDAGESDPQAMQSGFVYNDDWAIVSAPPPPGPYNPVNLDPRIPGQEDNIGTELSSHGSPPAMSPDRITEHMAADPPAAGQPVIESRPPAWTARQAPYSAPPVYRAPPVYGYGRTPPRVQSPWSAAPYPQSFPPAGWTGPGPGAFEEEVPPPPVYERMNRPPTGPYGYGSGRY